MISLNKTPPRRQLPRPQRNNKLGVLGVIQDKRGRFRARVAVGGRTFSVGTYGSSDEAAEARELAEKALTGPLRRLVVHLPQG